ncbi:MAG: hypothetical protein ACMG6E_09165 [Candidatus Roizmanbacteria bacterium]
MTKNPFLNAGAATLYISCVASLMFFGMKHTSPDNSVIVPIAMLSLATLSAAVMSYLFFSQPLQLYFDGKKKQAVDLFIKTLATFAGITILVFALLISGVFK